MRVLMLFLDGVGIGERNPSVNPLFRATLPALRSMLDGELPTTDRPMIRSRQATVIPLDANLGVEGLPQSGTGQTALFAGVNAPQIVGKHFGPYPYSTLRPIIKARNIFRQLLDKEKQVYFSNAYPKRFFDYFKDKQTRLTVTTLSCSYCDMPLHQADALARGEAISADITNAAWPGMGYANMATISGAEAGRRLSRLSEQHDFVLFEYWRTDKAGHSEKMEQAVEALELFDGMLRGILEHIDFDETILLITSDHGNIEDMSAKVHTRNPVPAIVYGKHHQHFAEMLLSSPDLTNVTPSIMRWLTTVPRGIMNVL